MAVFAVDVVEVEDRFLAVAVAGRRSAAVGLLGATLVVYDLIGDNGASAEGPCRARSTS